MKPARAATATLAPPVAAMSPHDDELVFDFGPDFTEPPKKAEHPWFKDAGGVKAAIQRWLEEQC